MRPRPLLFLWLLLVPFLRGARAAEPADAVTLPPFIVEEASQGPPWRYAEVAGFEILSRCSDRTTRDLVQTHLRLHRLLELPLPERLQLTFAVPKALIFYDEALQPAAPSGGLSGRKEVRVGARMVLNRGDSHVKVSRPRNVTR